MTKKNKNKIKVFEISYLVIKDEHEKTLSIKKIKESEIEKITENRENTNIVKEEKNIENLNVNYNILEEMYFEYMDVFDKDDLTIISNCINCKKKIKEAEKIKDDVGVKLFGKNAFLVPIKYL